MGSYGKDRKWSDQFNDPIRGIIGPLLLKTTSLEVDMKQAADFDVVFTAQNITIASRMRKHRYLAKYSQQFTVRSIRSNGVVTELAKIMNGFGDWFFYGFADETNTKIYKWWIIDLDSFRASQHLVYPEEIDNRDGTYGNAYDVQSFPDNPPILKFSSPVQAKQERKLSWLESTSYRHPQSGFRLT